MIFNLLYRDAKLILVLLALILPLIQQEGPVNFLIIQKLSRFVTMALMSLEMTMGGMLFLTMTMMAALCIVMPSVPLRKSSAMTMTLMVA